MELKEIVNRLKNKGIDLDSDFIKESETVIQWIVNEAIEAIEDTRCSLQLKDKETITFEEWKKIFYTPHQKGLYISKPDSYLKDEETLLRIYKAELNL